jgi:hypothetical protein
MSFPKIPSGTAAGVDPLDQRSDVQFRAIHPKTGLPPHRHSG